MKLFILLPRFPFPLEKGDKLRAFHQIRCLSRNNEIHLCAINDQPVKNEYIEKLKPYCKSINVFEISKLTSYKNVLKAFFSYKPFQVAYFYNSEIKNKIHDLINEINPDCIYCQLIRTAEYVKGIDINKTLDFQDAFSKNAARRAALSKFFTRAFYNYEADRVKKYETEMFNIFDSTTIITKEDGNFILNPLNKQIVVVRNGVDTDFFKPKECIKDFDIVFTGNMSYHPNVDAALFLANEIIPKIRNVRPDVKLLISGASPHKKLLACESENVHISGWVDDIRESYWRSRVFVAPLRMGTGLQNKLLEAMSMKMPCVTSDLANIALEAKVNQDLLIGGSADDFAEKIIVLLENDEYSKQLGLKGFQFVMNNYSWEAECDKLEKLFKR